MQLFLEFARETGTEPVNGDLYPLRIVDILRHTRIGDGNRLVEVLSAINLVYRGLRNDPEATLFGFDDHGHVYIHEATHRSVRHLWEQIVRSIPATPAPATSQEAGMPAFGFTPPSLGPSEPIAVHHAEHLTMSDFAA